MKRIGITTGDPAGIGPEITAKSLKYHKLQDNVAYVVYGKYIENQNGHKAIKIEDIDQAVESGKIYHIDINDKEIQLGCPSTLSGKLAYSILERCSNDAKNGKLDAIVTAPLSKKYIRDSHKDFIGHTEFLEKILNASDVAMTFWSNDIKVGLLTTHYPLHQLAEIIDEKYAYDKISLICQEVSKIIKNPKFALLGKNPHAGEDGAFGLTDEMFKSLVGKIKADGHDLEGPFPADTFFSYAKDNYDFIISPYHDQGLIPFKMLADGAGVNVTLGLPIYRASADHGTAFDIAKDNSADFTSMKSAIHWVESRLVDDVIQEKTYNEFGNFYDNYMAHVSYDKWTSKIKNWVSQYSSDKVKRIYELACGTGEIAKRMVNPENEVFAGDISEGMLHIAEKKETKLNLFRHNMLEELPVADIDLTLCVFDSINYLLSEDHVLTCFKNVKKAMSKTGLFIFDISTIYNCEEILDGFINYEEYADYKVLHTSDWDPDESLQKSFLDIYKKERFFCKNIQETHYQRIYPVRVIRDLLDKAGFELIAVYNNNDNMNLINYYPEDLDERFSRIYFIAK